MKIKKQLRKVEKKASKVRADFQNRYNKVAVRFNEVMIEMDKLLAEVAGEENAES